VLAFDLDHFKAINDVYGHAIGDRVLKAFADIARGVMGEDAVFARIGGEEFAALLHADKARNAKDVGEAVARRFAEAIAQHVDGMDVPATVSIGMALYQDSVPMLADGLAAADRALYRAKALGGNRLEFAEESESITA
jgi:diguanylate cyclase (GGDEF)-like protein